MWGNCNYGSALGLDLALGLGRSFGLHTSSAANNLRRLRGR